jgi:hypothetical protein
MARPLRIEFAGALYHLTSRGDRREDIYLDDADREIFLEVLGEQRGHPQFAVEEQSKPKARGAGLQQRGHPQFAVEEQSKPKARGTGS